VEAGKLACNLRQLDLFSLTDRIIDESRSSTGGKCRITLNAGDGFEHTQGDEGLLRHILGNLIGNAIKFTESGEVRVGATRNGDGSLHLFVSDSGIGIASEDLAHIFDEFFQLRNPERDRAKGSGLGLTICKRLVDAMGGKLCVESIPGKGSRFTVSLPAFTLVPQR